MKLKIRIQQRTCDVHVFIDVLFHYLSYKTTYWMIIDLVNFDSSLVKYYCLSSSKAQIYCQDFWLIFR